MAIGERGLNFRYVVEQKMLDRLSLLVFQFSIHFNSFWRNIQMSRFFTVVTRRKKVKIVQYVDQRVKWCCEFDGDNEIDAPIS